MPPGEFWQFLGESIGANPTPVAFAELYTALQTGTVDGQDNPLVSAKTMKFYEVTSQFVLTSHVIGYDVLSVSKKAWDGLGAATQAKLRTEATRLSTRTLPNTMRWKRRRLSSSRRRARRFTRLTKTLSGPSHRSAISTNTRTTAERRDREDQTPSNNCSSNLYCNSGYQYRG